MKSRMVKNCGDLVLMDLLNKRNWKSLYRVFQPSLVRAALICVVAVLVSGCSSEDVPSVENSTTSETFPLTAAVLEFTDSVITVEYTFTNNSENPRIIFEVGQGIQSDLIDGEVRLFKGQYDPEVLSVTPLLIAGEILPAGESITDTVSRPLPLTIDFDFINDQPIPFTDFEFCIGHSDPDDQSIPPEGEPFYFLNNFTENSANECLMLTGG